MKNTTTKSLLAAFLLFCAFGAKAQDCNSLYLLNSQNGNVYNVSALNGTLPSATTTLSTSARSNLAVGKNPNNASQTVFTASQTTSGSPVYVANTNIGTNLPAAVGGLTASPIDGSVYGMSGKNLIKASPTASNLGAISGDTNWSNGTASSDAFFDTNGNMYVVLTNGSAKYIYKINISTKVASLYIQLSGALPTNFQGLAFFNNRIYAIEGYVSGTVFTTYSAQVYEINPNTGVGVKKTSYQLNTGFFGGTDDLDLASCQALVPTSAPTCNELFGITNSQNAIYRINVSDFSTSSVATNTNGNDNLAYGPTPGDLTQNQFVTSKFDTSSAIYTGQPDPNGGSTALSSVGQNWGFPRGLGTNPSTGRIYGIQEKVLTTWGGSGSGGVSGQIVVSGDSYWTSVAAGNMLNDIVVDNGGNLYVIGVVDNSNIYLFRIVLNDTTGVPTTAVASMVVKLTDTFPANAAGNPGNGIAYLGDYFYYSRRSANTAALYRMNAMTGKSEFLATIGDASNKRDFGDLASCATVTNVPASFDFNCPNNAGGVIGGPVYANGTVQNRLLRVPLKNAVNGLAEFSLTGTGVTTSPSPYVVFIEQGATYVDIPFAYKYNNTGVAGTSTITVTSPRGNGNCSYTIKISSTKDSDGDGIPDDTDLDDDNDGILDTAEGCPISQNSINSTITYVGSDFAIATGSSGANMVDRISTGPDFSTFLEYQKPQPTSIGQNWVDKTIFELNLNKEVVVNNIKLAAAIGKGSLGGAISSSAKLQGFDGTSWIDLSVPVSGLNSFNEKTFANTLATTTPVSKVRLLGVNGALINFGTDNGKIAHVYVEINETLSIDKECDADGDGIPNRLDLDSDNDGCSDSNEYYNNTTSAASGQQYGQTGGAVAPTDSNGRVIAAAYNGNYANAIVATTATITVQPEVSKIIDAGTNTSFSVTATSTNTTTFNTTSPFAPNYASGTNNVANILYQWQVSTDNGSTWNSLSNGGVYSGVTTNTLSITAPTVAYNGYRYRAIVTLANHVCTNLTSNVGILTVNETFCYKSPVTDGNTYPSQHGITALSRAGVDDGNWPMVRQSAWTVLEAKTKGFVINRIPTTAQVNGIIDPVEGMMVFDVEADCLKINTNGTSTGWKCFNTQTCP